MKQSVKAVVAGLAIVAVSACGSSHTAPARKDPQGGGNFLPVYLDQLRGKQPFPTDTCEVHDLHDLLLPCDRQP